MSNSLAYKDVREEQRDLLSDYPPRTFAISHVFEKLASMILIELVGPVTPHKGM